MNKITGISIFAFPLLYICFGLDVAGIMICIVAFLSSFEEIAIMIKSKELNRDIKVYLCENLEFVTKIIYIIMRK